MRKEWAIGALGLVGLMLIVGQSMRGSGEASPGPPSEPPAAAPTAPTPYAPLSPLYAAASAAREPRDQFSDPVTVGLGQSFKMTLSPGDDGNGMFWRYRDGNLVYSAGSGLTGARPPNGYKTMDIIFSRVTSSLGTASGQNSFGARAQIERVHERKSSMLIISGPKPTYGPDDTKSLPPSNFPLSLKVSGDEGRRLSKTINVSIEGQIVLIPEIKATAECQESTGDATIRNPVERTMQTCFVGVQLNRLSYVDSSTGKVLKEFTR